MRSMDQRQQSTAPLAGIVLLAIGVGALAFRLLGVDLGELVGVSGWPLLVIVPGLLLLASALVPARPNGTGLAIAGSVVTTVGLLLLYQQWSGHWESWAYAWALLPTAAGVAMAAYGQAAGVASLRSVGLRLAGVGALMFVIGLVYFETLFDTGRVPFDLASWWPVIPLAAGVLLIARALVRPGDGGQRDVSANDAGANLT